jgi:RimJ/RimL family protein N-acetyltransferase
LHVAIYEECEEPGQLGYWVTDKHQRKGYVFEATKELIKLAKHLKLYKVWASVRYDNEYSIKLLEKLGMQYIQSTSSIYENQKVKEVMYEMIL